jgi:PAS domain S-box-containing protein
MFLDPGRDAAGGEAEHTCGAGRRDATWDVISEQINDLIVITDLHGAVFYASPATRTLGYEPYELVGLTGADLIHPDELGRFLANRSLVHAGDGSHQVSDREYRFRRKDGSWVWLEGNPTLLSGPAGQPVGVLNVFRDVTEQRTAREGLREQARWAAMAEEVAGVGYWRLDTKTMEAAWSPQIFRMHGLEAGDTIALARAMDQVHPQDQEASRERIARALETGEGWSDTLTRVIQPDGSLRYLSGRGICETDIAGRVTAVFGTALDVTAQVEARQALEQSERRYRLLAENATDMISSTAPDGRLTYLSPSVERVTGFKVDELLNGQMSEWVHPEDREAFMAAFSDLLAGRGEPGPIRFRAQHKDGHWMWLESNPRLVRDPDGAPVEIVDVTREVTVQQTLKTELRAALAEAEHAASVKAAFLANMSHEIRTPLTAVLGFAGLLAERRDLDHVAQGQIARIAGASRALLAVVNDLLDFSKLEAGEVTIRRRPTAAAQAAREVLEMFALQAEEKGLALAFSAEGLPASLLTDEDRLRQILTNLVGNAVKFTAKGRVALTLTYDATRSRLSAAVSDTGPGVAPQDAAKLFQRFSQLDGSSTRRKGGAGLGLAICHGLARAMDGEVSLESRLGVGSTFRLEIPALPANAPAAAPTGDSGPDRLFGLRVLVVDDNSVNRELARAILETAGVEVSQASGGQEAVDMAQRLPFDAILMDLRMPGLDGRGALAAIRRTPGPNQQMPILAFSADGQMDAAQARAAGFQGQVRKPTSPAEMLRALDRAVDPDLSPDLSLEEVGPCHAAAS